MLRFPKIHNREHIVANGEWMRYNNENVFIASKRLLSYALILLEATSEVFAVVLP